MMAVDKAQEIRNQMDQAEEDYGIDSPQYQDALSRYLEVTNVQFE